MDRAELSQQLLAQIDFLALAPMTRNLSVKSIVHVPGRQEQAGA